MNVSYGLHANRVINIMYNTSEEVSIYEYGLWRHDERSHEWIWITDYWFINNTWMNVNSGYHV